MDFKIKTEKDIDNMSKAVLAQLVMNKRPLFVTVENEDKKRTVPQNSLAHRCYATISKKLGEYTPLEVKCECKYNFAFPILLRNPQFETYLFGEKVNYYEFCKKLMQNMSYKERLHLMLLLPVTSLFNTEQHNEYLKTLQVHYLKLGVDLKLDE